MKDLLDKLSGVVFDLDTRTREMAEFQKKEERIIEADDREKLIDITSLLRICYSLLGEIMKKTWAEIIKKENQEIDRMLKEIFRDVEDR